MLQLEEEKTSPTVIKVVGVGGGGMNAIDRMIDADLQGVEFMVVNTDEQVIRLSAAEEKIVIGQKTTRGMGAGGDPEVGLRAAEEDRDRLAQALKGADMVFITAGMGGGTGTGAAPVVAEVAKSIGALTVGVVTLPFQMEGGKRMKHALAGLKAIKEQVDTLITIKNDHIFRVIDRSTSVDVAFRLVDDILLSAVRGISDLINTAGLVNVDFADVRTIMAETGDALMGAGEGLGEDRVTEAVNQAINNALLEEMKINGATGVLINVCGGQDLSMAEWKDVSELITAQVDPQANIIIGLTIDETLKERIRVTVIATGFQKEAAAQLPKAAGAGGPVWKNYQSHESPQPEAPFVSMRQPAAEPVAVNRTEDIYRAPAMAGRRPVEKNHAPAGIRQREPEPDYEEETDDIDGLEELESYDTMNSTLNAGVHPRSESDYIRAKSNRRLHSERSAERELDLDDLEIPAYLRRKDR